MSLADGLKVRASVGWIAQEKKDGVFATREFRDVLLVGEQMKDGTFWAFDVFLPHNPPYIGRWNLLNLLADSFPADIKLIPHGSGGEYLEHIIAQGGEGVVFKSLDCTWGKGQYKCKREETFDCVVSARNESIRSLSLIQFKEGVAVDCGNVASLSEFEWNTVKVGDVLEIKCQCRTKAGKFREPRIFRLRPDKLPQDCTC
jgi:hypothetical protein